MSTHNKFLWRICDNYPRIIIKYFSLIGPLSKAWHILQELLLYDADKDSL